MLASSQRGWDLREPAGAHTADVVHRLRRALDGNLLGPVAVTLKERFAHLFEDDARAFSLERVPGPRERWAAALEVLVRAGWLGRQGAAFRFTTQGAYAFARASSFGVPVSYLPLFDRIDDLLFGDVEAVWKRRPGEPEHLVDRVLNVRSSGAAHRRYFADADGVIRRLFNQPFPQQPEGFCDMGSGDGSWLAHVWGVVVNETERGRLMRENPDDRRYRPLLIGVEYNQEAREATAQHLAAAGIPCTTLVGDINDPRGLAAALKERGIDSRGLLHGNSFLVHNRPYTGVRKAAAVDEFGGTGAGAYAWRGRIVPNPELRQNLLEFFGSWREILGRHGLLVIELHDPETVIVGRTLTNYLLTHGLSDQFPVPLSTFLGAAAEAGLRLQAESHRTYPREPELATVSISHFVA